MSRVNWASALIVGIVASGGGLLACTPQPDTRVLQQCVQKHVDEKVLAQLGLTTASVLEPLVQQTRSVGGRLECDVEAPVQTQTIVGTKSTETLWFRVHLRSTESGIACEAVEER